MKDTSDTKATPNTQAKFPGAQSAGTGAVRRCQWRGCSETGVHRAPVDRDLNDYYVFCLDHVRSYNAQWNYHDGLGPEVVEMEYRSAATWDRPTWRMGDPRGPGSAWDSAFDPFDILKETNAGSQGSGPQPAPPTNEIEAYRVLGLAGPLTMEILKARYKVLVKRYHPDTNGGTVEAENRMKDINAAYETLKGTLQH